MPIDIMCPEKRKQNHLIIFKNGGIFFVNKFQICHIYFWYLTAPRRFVILLMRVFVKRSNAVVLLPKSDMLVRYFINEALSLLAVLELAAAPPLLLHSPFDRWPQLPSLIYEGKVEMVLLLLLLLLLLIGFRGNDDVLFVGFVLFERCVDGGSFEGFLFRFCAFCLLVFNWVVWGK